MFLFSGALSMLGLLLDITVISRPREPVEKREVSFDWPGSLLSILGIAVLFFGSERLGDDAGNSLGFWLISAAFRVAAGVALVGILVSMLRGRGNK